MEAKLKKEQSHAAMKAETGGPPLSEPNASVSVTEACCAARDGDAIHGDAVLVYSRSARQWCSGTIINRIERESVRVEYTVHGDTFGKTMHVSSHNLFTQRPALCSPARPSSETTAKSAAKSLTPEAIAEAEVKQQQVDTHMKEGEMALSQSDWDEAIRAFTKAIYLKPTFRGYAGRASAHLRRYKLVRDDDLKAEQNLNEALKIEPQNLIALCDRGEVRFKMGKLDEAAEDFNKILRINPNDGRALCGLGDVKMAEDDEEGALSYFQLAKQVNYPHAEVRRAAALRAVKKKDKNGICQNGKGMFNFV